MFLYNLVITETSSFSLAHTRPVEVWLVAQDENLSNLYRLIGLLPESNHSTIPVPPSALSLSLYSGTTLPTFSLSEVEESEQLFDKRRARLRELLPIRPGRTIPDDDDLLIGDARSHSLAILFLDICGFSSIESVTLDEQTNVLTILNLFMAEMLRLVKKNGGEFEKNTGDGLMAYFKTSSPKDSAKVALETATAMHFFNDNVIVPRFKLLGLPTISFRVGIEVGDVILANVGVRGDHHSIVAVGTPANVACKMMRLIQNGGIVMGNHTFHLLPPEWQSSTAQIGTLPGYVIIGTQTPYPVYSFNYRPTKPVNFAEMFGGLKGIL